MAVTLTDYKGAQYIAQGLSSNAGLNDTVTLARVITRGDVAFQITGTWTGTVTFEATVDGTTWVTFNVTPSASGTDVSTATAVGAWSKTTGGYAGFRIRVSIAGTGTPTFTVRINSSSK